MSARSRRSWLVPGVLIAAMTVQAAAASAMSAGACADQPATGLSVLDSIRAVRFDRETSFTPGDGRLATWSPDGSSFWYLTTRGDLRTDRIVSTLHLWRPVSGNRDDDSTQPAPLVEAHGVPQGQRAGSRAYAGLITQVRWSPDSEGLYYLEEQPDGRRALFNLPFSTRVPRALSTVGQDVVTYSVSGPTIAYITKAWPTGAPGPESAVRETYIRTGASLPELLADGNPYTIVANMALHVHGPGGSQVLDGGRQVLPQYDFVNLVSLSPNGEQLIFKGRVQSVPAHWERFATRYEGYRFRRGPTPLSVTTPVQFFLYDIRTQAIRPLLDAPTGFFASSLHVERAIWAEDGGRVLITNSFVPTPGILTPVAAATIDLRTNTIRIVEHAGQDPSDTLVEARFGADSSHILLAYDRRGVRQERHFSLGPGGWRPDETRPHRSSGPSPRFEALIEQGLNSWPSLVVADRRGGRIIGRWQANPDLLRRVLTPARTVQWSDSTGHVWRGVLVLPRCYRTGVRYPLVIQTHGYDPNSFIIDGFGPSGMAARALAEEGMMVLQMEMRADVLQTPAEGEVHVEGFRSGIRHLAAAGLVDPARVGLIGFSRTVYHVKDALVRHPGEFAAASVFDGSDMSYVQALLTPDRHSDSFAIHGGPPFGETLGSWLRGAPNFSFARVETPLLIGARRRTGLITEWESYALLRLRDRPVELFYFPQASHELQRPSERFALQQNVVDWFAFWLLGQVRSTPIREADENDDELRAKYARWQSYRQSGVQN